MDQKGNDLYRKKVRDLTIKAGINPTTGEPSLFLGTGKINTLEKMSGKGHPYFLLKMDGFDKLTAIVNAILVVTKEIEKRKVNK